MPEETAAQCGASTASANNGDDRLRPRRDRRLDRGRIEVVRLRVDVRKDRCRALVDRAVRRRDERVRRRDHLVAGADTRRGACRDAGRRCPTRRRRSTARRRHRRTATRSARPVGPSDSQPERSTSSTSSSSRSSIHGALRLIRLVAVLNCARAAGRARATAPSARSCPRTVSRYAFWIASVISPDAELVVVDRAERRHLGGGAAHEHLVGEVEIGADQRLLEHRVAEVLRDLRDRVARDARQDPGREIGRVDDAVAHDEDVLARAVGDGALGREQDRLVVAGVVRLGHREHRVEVDARRLRDVRDDVRRDALPGRDLRADARSAAPRRRGTAPHGQLMITVSTGLPRACDAELAVAVERDRPDVALGQPVRADQLVARRPSARRPSTGSPCRAGAPSCAGAGGGRRAGRPRGPWACRSSECPRRRPMP